MEEIWKRKHIPILVGGSGFYAKSLFFPPRGHSKTTDITGNWSELNQLDPVRAATIHEHDTYRISRALQLITQNKTIKASELEPIFNPLPGDCLVVFLTRDRQELYHRINTRTEKMVTGRWIQEVEDIIGTNWQNFLYQKKLIGYTEILEYLEKGDLSDKAKKAMVQKIAQKTRHYAKRQETFWKMFKKILTPYFIDTQSEIIEINLSNDSQCLKLKETFKNFVAREVK